MASTVPTSESTTLGTYTNLTTVGPFVTVDVPASRKVLVSVAANTDGDSSSTSCLMSYALSGANNTLPADDANAVILAGSSPQRASAISVLTLNPGSTTFTAMYRVQGQGSFECFFANRAIAVLQLP